MLLLAALTTAAVLPALLPASEQTRAVLVAAQDLPRGTVLEAEDLRPVTVPAALAPIGSTADPALLVGVRIPQPIAQGDVLRPDRIDALARTPSLDGRALLVLPVEDLLRDRLVIGDQLGIVISQTEPGRSRVITAVIVDIPISQSAPQSGLLSPSGGGSQMAGVIVAVTPDECGDLAHALHEGWFLVTAMD